MTRTDLLETVQAVFRECLENESICLTETTTASAIEGWDSLGHVGLMIAVEKKTGIKFSMGEIVTMQNIGEMLDIIEERSPLK